VELKLQTFDYFELHMPLAFLLFLMYIRGRLGPRLSPLLVVSQSEELVMLKDRHM
jgi:hypothetical protein